MMEAPNRSTVLIGVLVLLLGFVWGAMTVGLQLPPHGFVRAALRVFPPMSARNASDTAGRGRSLQQKMDQFKGLGYAGGFKKHRDQPTGVLHHSDSEAYGGLNLYVSGHGPEAILMNMDGEVLHRWRFPFEKAFPERAEDTGDMFGFPGFWRRCRVFPNGDMIAVFDYMGIIKIDRHSNLEWASEVRAHHDLWVHADGTIYTLAMERTSRPEVVEGVDILEDFIAILSPEGKVRRTISLLDALLDSEFATTLAYSARTKGPILDPLHANTLELFVGSDRPYPFVEGHALVAFNNPNVIGVVDLSEPRIVFTQKGLARGIHDPQLVDGNLLFFGNNTEDDFSKIVEMDPSTQRIVWTYQGNEENRFHSPMLGSVQRLPNGNTLINESTSGRSFEVTPAGKRVWEFRNPHRAGKDDADIATIPDMQRIPANFFGEWLRGVRR